MGKRAHGEGGVRRRNDGRWEASVSAGYYPDGRRRRLYAYAHRRVDAYAELEQLRREAARLERTDTTGVDLDPAVPLATFLSWYLDEIVPASDVAPSTVTSYRQAVRNRVEPYAIGRVAVRDLTAPALELWVAQLTGTYAPLTVHQTWALVSRAVRDLLAWGVLDRDPRDGVSLPAKRARREGRYLPADAARRLLDATDGTRLGLAVRLSLLGGLRRGEVLGSRWSDLDLERGTLTVAVQRVRRREAAERGDREVFVPVKGRRARSITLGPGTLERLAAHRRAQVEQRLRAGPRWSDPAEGPGWATILTSRADLGQPWTRAGLWDAWSAARRDLDLGEYRWHDLRHSAATFAQAEGASVRELSGMLGHSSPSVTLSVYAHVIPELAAERAAAVEARLTGGGGGTVGGQVGGRSGEPDSSAGT